MKICTSCDAHLPDDHLPGLMMELGLGYIFYLCLACEKLPSRIWKERVVRYFASLGLLTN